MSWYRCAQLATASALACAVLLAIGQTLKSYTSAVGVLFIFGMSGFAVFFFSAVLHPLFLSPLRKLPRNNSWWFQLLKSRLVSKVQPSNFLLHVANTTRHEGLIALREICGYSILLCDAHSLKDVLFTHPDDFQKSPSLRALLGFIAQKGLFFVEGGEHKDLRKKSLPLFSYRVIQELYPVMWEHAVRLCQNMERALAVRDDKAQKSPIDFEPFAQTASIAIIASTVFGRDVPVEDDPTFQDMMHHIRGFLEPSGRVVTVMAAAFLAPLSVIRLILPRATKEFMTHSESSLNRALEMVRWRRAASGRTTSSEHAPERTPQTNLLDAMIMANNLPDEKMAAQLITYMLAGNETTSATATWAVGMLALHPECQRLLRSEVTDALRPMIERGVMEISSLGPMLERLPYLNGVVNEALRLYPTIPLTSRTAVRDTHILGQFVPKGTTLYISPWQRQRDPKVWGADAEIFRPERWILDETGPDGLRRINQGHNLYDLITFIHGPKNCIGQRFAKAGLRCLLAAVVFHFQWTTDARELPSGYGVITLRPAGGMPLRFQKIRKSECDISGNCPV
ncbi:hypothetical protein CBER1_11207 [Cercospora berteroae]|uniref:Cytochrome P450 n=1 Tax=Cercospora berteroae TaxID=357750 RepID=A0A2S6CMC9_9PEZI|nr:hypothetical protein CBER1_11207 [Cercospora berteroae]